MITSFADGTKLSMECAILANAAGFSVGQRGMFGPKCDHVTEVTRHFTAEQLLASPLVDYTLGAAPNNGAFVVAYTDHPIRQQYMSYFKMGDGPLYVFYTPYHLPQVQVAMTIARAVLFNDPTVTPAGAPTTDVVTLTKRPLKAGEVLDGIGGFMSYGLIDNATVAHRDNLLPISLSEGCRLRHDVDKDRALTCDDVVVPEGRLVDRLRAEQHRHFAA
jgi:predicted homoserine dehydrogenase-like protein